MSTCQPAFCRTYEGNINCATTKYKCITPLPNGEAGIVDGLEYGIGGGKVVASSLTHSSDPSIGWFFTHVTYDNGPNPIGTVQNNVIRPDGAPLMHLAKDGSKLYLPGDKDKKEIQSFNYTTAYGRGAYCTRLIQRKTVPKVQAGNAQGLPIAPFLESCPGGGGGGDSMCTCDPTSGDCVLDITSKTKCSDCTCTIAPNTPHTGVSWLLIAGVAGFLLLIVILYYNIIKRIKSRLPPPSSASFKRT